MHTQMCVRIDPTILRVNIVEMPQQKLVLGNDSHEKIRR